ncbi:hypothetical protein GQ54DRAFT_300959 [Martensiomyces pterosporus]|nr:hypothetical protein GQ54DRAFT_300959 [Martensiomyces pterosporus]
MVWLLSALSSLSARFGTHTSSSGSNALVQQLLHALGFFDGSEAWWCSEEEARELRVKHSVAVSDMASTITGFVQEMEACMPVGEDVAEHMEAGTATVPLAQDICIVRACQLALSCFDSLVGGEPEA